MPQNPLQATIALNQENAQASARLDAVNNLNTQSGGASSSLDITAAKVIKATPGRLRRLVVLGVVGTGGSITLNDCATTGAAAAANEIFTASGTLAVGTVINLDWPCQVGIVISAVATGGTPLYAVSYD